MTNWISVRDRLPNPRERVLVSSNEGIHSGFWDGYNKERPSWQCDPIGSYAGDGCVYDVINWMPLPKPPKETNEPSPN